MSGDTELMEEIGRKIGIADENDRLTAQSKAFLEEHPLWAARNRAWVQEHLDPQKAKAYVMANK